MLSNNLLRNLESAQGRMDQLQNQLSSTHRINRPSDDPVGIQNAMRLKSNISSVEQWKSNADSAMGYMYTTDSTLGDITSILNTVKDRALLGANGVLTTADKEAIAKEVDQISEQLVMLANTRVGSKYIFSGTATDKELIPASGTSEANNKPVNFEVGNNLSISVSVDGPALYGDIDTGIVATLKDLSEALRGTSTSFDTVLGKIDTNIDNVIALRSDLGARTNRMTALRDQLDSTSINLKANLSSIQDTDMAKTLIDFTSQENVYRAALAVGAKIIQPSLVDFMR